MRSAWLFGATVASLICACFSEAEQACTPGVDRCGVEGTTGDAPTTGMSTTTEPSTMTSTTRGDSTSESATDTGDGSSGEADTDADGSSTGEPLCGNGVLDPGEECDGTSACTDCELDNFDCNPLNNAGCPANAKCSYNDDTGLFWCLPFSKRPPGQLHEYSCYSGGPQDQWCDVGLACMPGQTNGACDDGGCCVEFCDIFDDDFECAQEGDSCVVWFLPGGPAGLEWLGVCATA